MARELLTTLFCLAAIHSVYSLGETDVDLTPTPSVLSCKKCPPGFSTFCSQNGTSRCVPCVAGTFSENLSRRRSCRPCSSCQDGEFELRPCTPTSNVRCKECSKCPPGFVVLKSCEGTRDTVCEKCSVAKGYVNYANIECDEDEIEDHLKNTEKDKPKGSMIIIEVEKPWPDGERKPKHQYKPLTADENHPTATVSPRLPSVKPTPSSSFSTKIKTSSSKRVLSFHSEVFASSSSCVEVSSMPSIGGQTSINRSLTPTMPAKPQSPPKIQRTKPPTTKAELDTNTEESSSYEMQGDDGNIPHHGQSTQRSINENMNHRGKRSTIYTTVQIRKFSIKEYLKHTDERMPGDRNRSKSSPAWLWGVVVVVATGVVMIAFVVILVSIRRRQGRKSEGCPQTICRRPRCPVSSDCCDEHSVSSDAGEYVDQEQNEGNHDEVSNRVPIEIDSSDNSNNPTIHTWLYPERSQQATVFELWPDIREQSDRYARSYPEYITVAEGTFTSSGGTLCAPDSNIRIIVDKGTVREGDSQRIFFRVIYDEGLLLQSFTKAKEMTLISPVIECGPDDINLLKPVEIKVPHCLCLDEVKKESIIVYRCGHNSDQDGINWEKVPSASEKNWQSKSWFTVKKDSIYINTKTFSFWSIFACGGPKRKRATVFCSRPSPESDLIYLRFYIYSDNEDSKKRLEARDRKRFSDSKPAAKEKPFRMYNDNNDVIVKLTDLKEWEMDTTPSEQRYPYETAYGNGFRAKDSCDFAVKPTHQVAKEFSCNLWFQQEEHTSEYTIYVNPGLPRRQTNRRLAVDNSRSETPSNNTCATGAGSTTVAREENGELVHGQENETSEDSQAKVSEPSLNHCFVSLGSDKEPVTQSHCNLISPLIGGRWKKVLRNLNIDERPTIENVDNNNDAVEEKSYQGLLAWMRSRGTQEATTKKLCVALRLAGCSEALEALLKEGISCDDCDAPILESNADFGTRV